MSPRVLFIVGGSLFATLVILYGLLHRDQTIKEIRATPRSTWIAVVGFVVFSMFLSIIWIYELLEKYDAHKVNTLTYVAPVFTLILAAIFLGEKPTLYSIIGVLMVVSGIVLIATTCTK